MMKRTSHARNTREIPDSPGRPSTGLGQVVQHLNRLRDPQAFDSQQRQAWSAAERVVGALVEAPAARYGTTLATQAPPPSPRWALASFNRLARQVPVPLTVQGIVDRT